MDGHYFIARAGFCKETRPLTALYNIEVRDITGTVHRHFYKGTESQIDQLLSRMREAETHMRDLSDSPYWAAKESSVWVNSSHRGRSGAGSYYYTAIATEAKELEIWVQALYKNYHPMGYGTHMSKPQLRDDGLWVTTGGRAGSCD